MAQCCSARGQLREPRVLAIGEIVGDLAVGSVMLIPGDIAFACDERAEVELPCACPRLAGVRGTLRGWGSWRRIWISAGADVDCRASRPVEARSGAGS
jgi:hypothetical protein